MTEQEHEPKQETFVDDFEAETKLTRKIMRDLDKVRKLSPAGRQRVGAYLRDAMAGVLEAPAQDEHNA